MSSVASVGLLIICMIMQCQAELKAGDVANQDLCCRLMYGKHKECNDDFMPVCAKWHDYEYIPMDNICKFCASYGNSSITIYAMGDMYNIANAWPDSCKQMADGGYDQVYNPDGK